MQVRMWLVLMTLLAALASVTSTSTVVRYYVVPAYSTSQCQHYPVDSCYTLDQLSALINEKFNGSLTLVFLPGEHTLTWYMRIEGAADIFFYSTSISSIRFLPNTGMNFVSIQKLIILGLVIHGSERYDNGGAISVVKAADVFIQDCQFINNRVREDGIGSGGAVSVDHSPRVRINHSMFINNSAMCPRCGGGALSLVETHVEIEGCHFQFNKANATGGAIEGLELNGEKEHVSMLSIFNTNFSSNSANRGGAVSWEAVKSLTLDMCRFTSNSAVTNGGAISAFGLKLVSMRNMYSDNSGQNGGAVYGEELLDSQFNCDRFERNSGQKGAAVYQQSVDSMELTSSNFTNNWLTSDGTGAVYVEQLSLSISRCLFMENQGSLYTINSKVLFTSNSTHINNTGEVGGAFTVINGVLTISEFASIHIGGNTANFGGGLYLEQSTVNMYGLLVITHNTAHELGGGIYAFESNLELRPQDRSTVLGLGIYTNIIENIAVKDGGGVYLLTSTIRVSAIHVNINNNTAGHYGGGVYADEGSKFILNKLLAEEEGSNYIGVQAKFTNNSALRGGAVYISDTSSSNQICTGESSDAAGNLGAKECFFQTLKLYKEAIVNYKTVATFFEQNSALEAGNDIYGGLLDRCTLSPLAEIIFLEPKARFFNGLEYLNATANFSQPITRMSDFYNHISSDPVRLCFCENGMSDCGIEHPTVHTKKGGVFTLTFTAVDEVGKPVRAKLISSLNSEKGAIGRLKEGQQERLVEDNCTELEYNAYSSESKATLELHADGPCADQGISKQLVNITFLPCNCPVGLARIPPIIECQCDCDERIKSFVSNCSATNSSVQINKNVWIEFVNLSNASGFVTQDCPFDYCLQRPVNVSFSSQSETDYQCAFNRTEVMCGQCETGLSLVFSSSSCQQCSNYYLFLILPFALAGIALVAFILMLNMTVATGTIHGLVFYANILAANRSIFLPFDTPNFLTVFVSWLNLDLGIETCFYNGMDSYAKFLLQLVFPAFVFLLIILFIVLSNFLPQRIRERVGKRNPETTLYTLIFLSYSKVIRIIIAALQYTVIHYPNHTQKIVWLYDANILYFSASHIPRFLIAILITIVGTVYTTLLLFGQLFDRCSNYRMMKWTTHSYYFHFMKAHHAPLSGKHRYWVGVLLLSRLVHYLISAFSPTTVIILSAGTIPLALVAYKLFILFLYPNPQHSQQTSENDSRRNGIIYSSSGKGLLETSFLLNLIVLALARFYVGDVIWNQQLLAFVSMAVSLVTFVAIALYHTGFFNHKLFKRIRLCLVNRYQVVPNNEEGPIMIVEEHREEEDEELLEDQETVHEYTGVATTDSTPNDPGRYITPPIIRPAVCDDQLREPALDDLAPVQQEDYKIVMTPARRRVSEMMTFTEIKI